MLAVGALLRLALSTSVCWLLARRCALTSFQHVSVLGVSGSHGFSRERCWCDTRECFHSPGCAEELEGAGGCLRGTLCAPRIQVQPTVASTGHLVCRGSPSLWALVLVLCCREAVSAARESTVSWTHEACVCWAQTPVDVDSMSPFGPAGLSQTRW